VYFSGLSAQTSRATDKQASTDARDIESDSDYMPEPDTADESADELVTPAPATVKPKGIHKVEYGLLVFLLTWSV